MGRQDKTLCKNNCPTDDRIFLPGNSTAWEEDCRQNAGQQEGHTIYHCGPAGKKLTLGLGCVCQGSVEGLANFL
jgi:hypothetical protein